jgi:hypothetical protein
MRTHASQLAKGVKVLPVWLTPPAPPESQWLNRVLTVLSKLAVDSGLANPQYAGSSDLVSLGFFQRLHNGVPFYRIQPVCVGLCESIVSNLFGN